MIHDFNDFHNEHNKNSKPPLASEGMQNNLISTQSTTHHERPLNRILNAIISRGGTVTGTGAQRMCSCPAHEDRTPSLSIKEAPDGTVLLHCHARCSTKPILQSLGLSMRDLYPHDTTATVNTRINGQQNRQGVSDSAGRAMSQDGFDDLESAMSVYAKSLGLHDHRWEYHNAADELVGVILRWETPKGKEVRPISLIDGCWQLKGMPNPCTLYRLPSILNSEGPVIVCEGEKAAEAAIVCGFVATTSPHGSKSASKADWSVLQGRDVVVIPDLDDAGDAYADDVIELCQRASSIRVVDLSLIWEGLGDGDDLHDALVLESGDVRAVGEKLAAGIDRCEPMTGAGAGAQEDDPSVYRSFPIEHLPEAMRDYVQQGAESIGCDPSYIALPMFSMFAGAIGNTHCVEVKRGWIEPPVIWSCIVGRSGTSKSPALELAFKPLDLVQERMYIEHQHECAMLDADPLTSNGSSASKPARCIIDDATLEAALECMRDNPRGLVLKRDELAGWFDFDRYSSGKSVGSSGRWIEFFHGRSVCVDRRTSGSIFVRRASLSITGSIQPGVLTRIMDPKNLDSGLIARFLFAMPDPKPKRWSDRTVHPAVARRVNRIVERLCEHSMCVVGPDGSEENPTPHVIALHPEATEVLRVFADEHNLLVQRESEHIGAAWTKLECIVPRLALIMHLVREASSDPNLSDSELIDASTIRAAIELVKWFRFETKRIYTYLSLDPVQQETQRVIQWISSQGGAVTSREFSRGLAKYNSSKMARAKLNELVQAGLGTFQGRKPTGRTQEFVLHTKYRSQADTTVTDGSTVSRTFNGGIGSGASVEYPVQFTKEGK